MQTRFPTIILRDDIILPGKKPFIYAINIYSNITPMPTPIPPAVPKSKKFKKIVSKFMDLYR